MGYAQARMQARHGTRPGTRAWALLNASTTFAAALENARASSLESWTAGLDPAARPADVERMLRERLLGRIAEAARWMPETWRAAVLWTQALLELPPRQRRLREAADEDRAAAVRREWLAHWRTLWPPCAAEERDALEELVRTVEAHLERFSRATAEEAEPLRLALRARVETLFRRHAPGPAAAFDHLLLLALECERLRAALLGRSAW